MHAENFLAGLGELTATAAERWVAAALAEEAALREHDERLYPSAADAAATATAQRLHAAWRRWADDAQALLDQLGRAGAPGGSVSKANELERAVARARAMLKLTPERINERRRQARDGQTFTGEEVRRELGLPPRR